MRQHRFEEDEESTVFMQREAPALGDLVRTLAPRRRVEDRLLGASDDSMSIDEIAQSTFGPWDDTRAPAYGAHDVHEDDELDPTDSPRRLSAAEAEGEGEADEAATSDEEPSLFNRPFFEQAFSRRIFAEGDYEEAAPLPEHEGTMIYVAPPPPSPIVSPMALSAPPPPPNHMAFAPMYFAPPCAVHPATDPALAPTVSILASASPSTLQRVLASPLVAVSFAAVFAAALVVIAFVKLGVPSNAAPVHTRNAATSPAVVAVTAPTALAAPVVVVAPPAEIAAPITTPSVSPIVADAKPVAVETKPSAPTAPKPVAPQAKAPAPGFQVSFAVHAPAAKEKPKPQVKRGARQPSVEEILATLREEQLKR